MSDCVYEPLYGESWVQLSKVLEQLSTAATCVLCSVERRNADGVDRFLGAMQFHYSDTS